VHKLSVELGPRDERHIENLDRVAEYIKDEFSQATPFVSEQEYGIQGNSYRNVIARFGPETGERIIVGAHYDAAGPLPGADDNASGVAALIELARLAGPTTTGAASGTRRFHAGRAAAVSHGGHGQFGSCEIASAAERARAGDV
jgi:hypothetical protein